MNQKILIPVLVDGEYDNLSAAVDSLAACCPLYLDAYLKEIVEFNLGYRDLLRCAGVDAVVQQFLAEAPQLEKHPKAMSDFRERLDELAATLAPFDIQCINIADDFQLFGKTIHGLADLLRGYEIFAFEELIYGRKYGRRIHTGRRKGPATTAEGLHVGNFYENYPRFDSSDALDDRTYQNYIVRPRPITTEDFSEISAVKGKGNNCRVHEGTPASLLPLVYYQGAGDYMLVATEKAALGATDAAE